jgi:hypothetical protein
MRRPLWPVLFAIACAAPLEAGAESFELANGDTVTGEVVEQTDERIVLLHPILGHIEIPVAQLAAEGVRPGLFGTGFLRGWTKRIGLGVAGAEGNTVRANVTGDVAFSYEDDVKRWLWSASYFWGSSDRDTDTNKAFAGIERDFKFEDEPYYLFARGSYSFDEFRGFKHRVAGNAGLGWWFLQLEWWKLGSRVGAGLSYQWDDEEALRPEAVVGLDSIWPISETHRFEIHGDVFPDLSDLGEFRTHSTADWVIDLSEGPGLGLAIGAIHEYVSDTDQKHHDVTYRGLVTYDF